MFPEVILYGEESIICIMINHIFKNKVSGGKKSIE